MGRPSSGMGYPIPSLGYPILPHPIVTPSNRCRATDVLPKQKQIELTIRDDHTEGTN